MQSINNNTPISAPLAIPGSTSFGAAPTTAGSLSSPASRTDTGWDPSPSLMSEFDRPAPSAAPGRDDSTVGGGLGDALLSGVAKIVNFAQRGMDKVQESMQADMAETGTVDAAKLQKYSMDMTNYELLNKMAQNIQEKQDRAAQVWLN